MSDEELEGLGRKIVQQFQQGKREDCSNPKNKENMPEIIVSRKPSLNYLKYSVGIGSLRKLMKQTPEQIVSKLQKLLPTKTEKELSELSSKIDPVILEGIMKLKDRNLIDDVKITEALQRFDDKETSEEMAFCVTYDMKDLSKGAFLPWNRKNRDKIAEIAEDNRERGIADFKDGQDYEPNPIKRMLKRLTRGKLGEGKQKEEEETQDIKSRRDEFYEFVKNTEKSEYYKIMDEINKVSDEKDLDVLREKVNNMVKNKKIEPHECSGLMYNIDLKKKNANKEADVNRQTGGSREEI